MCGQTGSQLSEEAGASKNLKKKKKKKKMDRALRVCTKGRENLGLEASKEAWWAEWVAEMGEHSRRKRQSGGACIHKHNVME